MRQRFLLCLLLVMLTLAGCAHPSQTKVTLKLLYQNRPIDCLADLRVGSNTFKVQNLLLYLSDIAINGEPVAIVATANSDRENGVALLGLRCGSTPYFVAESITLAGTIGNHRKPVRLDFTLGVPSPLNHQNPLQAKAPLTASDMFWTWQQGYKFLRLDLAAENAAHDWYFHLGAFGCESPSSQRPPVDSCSWGNRFNFSIAEYWPGTAINLHLDWLLTEVNLAAGNCMGNPETSACEGLFSALNETQERLFTAEVVANGN